MKCSWCGKLIEPGIGITFVTAQAKILHFCSRKCRRAWQLGRSRRLGWLRKEKK